MASADTEHRFLVVGYVNSLRIVPSFITPLFWDILRNKELSEKGYVDEPNDDGDFLVQTVDRDGQVIRFEPYEVYTRRGGFRGCEQQLSIEGTLVPFPESEGRFASYIGRTKFTDLQFKRFSDTALINGRWGRVGGPALYGFQFAEADVVCGSAEYLNRVLTARISDLSQAPYVKWEVAHLIGDASLIAEAENDIRNQSYRFDPELVSRSLELSGFNTQFVGGTARSHEETENLPDEQVAVILTGIAEGDSKAGEVLWKHFGSLITMRARRAIRGSVLATDEDDIAQSTLQTFLTHARKGRYRNVVSKDDLWRLLLGTTKQEAKKVLEKESRQEKLRQKYRDQVLKSWTPTYSESLSELTRGYPDSLFAALNDESLRLLDKLSNDVMRRVAIARLEGYTMGEIASQHMISLKEVRLTIRQIRLAWADERLDG